ncbi:hypothetical protein SAMN05216404_102226 [Nitrosospira multiformis]|uniref:Uncharacterized protein n=1 Tax=Nitrosospira multiformis TaxID=1231 RepID=A0A1H8DBL4_9PROT|nr:hypothetical protein SAMN05216404_102226 [Nitrosospira multiformis]
MGKNTASEYGLLALPLKYPFAVSSRVTAVTVHAAHPVRSYSRLQGLIHGFMLFWKTFDAASFGPIRIIHIFKPHQQNYPFRRC